MTGRYSRGKCLPRYFGSGQLYGPTARSPAARVERGGPCACPRLCAPQSRQGPAGQGRRAKHALTRGGSARTLRAATRPRGLSMGPGIDGLSAQRAASATAPPTGRGPVSVAKISIVGRAVDAKGFPPCNDVSGASLAEPVRSTINQPATAAPIKLTDETLSQAVSRLSAEL
jgi:hypothetical protein